MINRIQAIVAALQQVGVGETSRVLISEDATVDRPYVTGSFYPCRLETFASLALEVDAILHMAATRSCWDIYSLLRPINVTSTKLLVQMASERKIPIHYASSADVVSAEGVEIPAGSAAKYPPRVDGSNSYVALR
ncbi:unnamed protein product [Penicillium palitans]